MIDEFQSSDDASEQLPLTVEPASAADEAKSQSLAVDAPAPTDENTEQLPLTVEPGLDEPTPTDTMVENVVAAEPAPKSARRRRKADADTPAAEPEPAAAEPKRRARPIPATAERVSNATEEPTTPRRRRKKATDEIVVSGDELNSASTEGVE